MPKLTNAQLVILTAAASHRDGAALPPPKSLKIKGRALAAVLDRLRKKKLLEERPAATDEIAWRESEEGGRLALFVTEAGLQALGVEPTRAAKIRSKAQPKPRQRKTRRRAGNPNPKAEASHAGTKQSLLIDLLNRSMGATIAEAAAATGWQAHSIRGAISGALKKKLGLTIASETVKDRGGRVYRILGHG